MNQHSDSCFSFSEATLTKLGHNFVTEQLKEWINWCDACAGVIMGVFGGTAQVCTSKFLSEFTKKTTDGGGWQLVSLNVPEIKCSSTVLLLD